MASMEEFLESQFGLIQCGLALAVPAVLAAVVNIGCGKKRDQAGRANGKKAGPPGSRAAGSKSKSKKDLKRSTRSGRSGSASASKKSARSNRAAVKSVDSASMKTAKPLKEGSSRSSSKKSKRSNFSKKTKRDAEKTKSKAGDLKQSAKQVVEDTKKLAKTGVEAVKEGARDLKESTKDTADRAKNNVDNSLKSARTQASASMKQPPSGGTYDVNANAYGYAGDSTRELKMEPGELRWSSAGGMQKISLINQSAERKAIKVKCSDNNVYRVNPVYAIVEPGQTLNVDIMRQNGSNKVDKIIFVTAPAGSENDAKNAFKSGNTPAMMVLPLLATSSQQQPSASINA